MSARRKTPAINRRVNGRELAASPGSAFVEAEGMVHLVNPLQGEHTMCGDAFDLASDIDGYEWKDTIRRTITCPSCARVIQACRGVRVDRPNSVLNDQRSDNAGKKGP